MHSQGIDREASDIWSTYLLIFIQRDTYGWDVMSSGSNIAISTHCISWDVLSLALTLCLKASLLFATTDFLPQTMKLLEAPPFLIFLPNLKTFQREATEYLLKSELNNMHWF